MNIEIFPDKESLSQAAAQLFSQIARKAVDTHGRFFIVLSGGGAPRRLYQILSRDQSLPWAQTRVFWGDERLVPPDDPGSNYGQAKAILLDRVPIPPENIHRMRGELDADTAVADYTAQLRQFSPGQPWPRFDLALLGMGGDGHTASLFPGPVSEAENTQPVVAVTAHYGGRPAQRITLAPRVFNDAAHILFLVAGANKADALAAVLQGPPQPEKYPAQRIQPRRGSLAWFVDDAAASKLNN